MWKDSNENKRVTCTCIRNVLTKLNQGDPIVQCLVNSMASQHLHKKEGTKQALTAISTIPRIPPIQTATTGFVTVIQLTTDLLSRELCFRLDSKSSPPPLFYFTECLTFHCLFLSFMSGHVWNILKLLITFLFFFFLLKLHSIFRLLFCTVFLLSILFFYILYSKLIFFFIFKTFNNYDIFYSMQYYKFYSNLQI